MGANQPTITTVFWNMTAELVPQTATKYYQRHFFLLSSLTCILFSITTKEVGPRISCSTFIAKGDMGLELTRRRLCIPNAQDGILMLADDLGVKKVINYSPPPTEQVSFFSRTWSFMWLFLAETVSISSVSLVVSLYSPPNHVVVSKSSQEKCCTLLHAQ